MSIGSDASRSPFFRLPLTSWWIKNCTKLYSVGDYINFNEHYLKNTFLPNSIKLCCVVLQSVFKIAHFLFASGIDRNWQFSIRFFSLVCIFQAPLYGWTILLLAYSIVGASNRLAGTVTNCTSTFRPKPWRVSDLLCWILLSKSIIFCFRLSVVVAAWRTIFRVCSSVHFLLITCLSKIEHISIGTIWLWTLLPIRMHCSCGYWIGRPEFLKYCKTVICFPSWPVNLTLAGLRSMLINL